MHVTELTESHCSAGSISIYEWEKKLGLREKYPDVIKNRGKHKGRAYHSRFNK